MRQKLPPDASQTATTRQEISPGHAGNRQAVDGPLATGHSLRFCLVYVQHGPGHALLRLKAGVPEPLLPGIAPLVSRLYFLGSVQLLALGIIGEYVGCKPSVCAATAAGDREWANQLLPLASSEHEVPMQMRQLHA